MSQAYTRGNNPNSIVSLHSHRPPKGSTQRRLNHITLAELLLALRTPHTIQEISEACGLHYGTTQQFLATLHSRQLIHITDWLPDERGRHLTRVYAWGFGRDATRPKLTQAQRQQRSRDSKRAREAAQSLGMFGQLTLGSRKPLTLK